MARMFLSFPIFSRLGPFRFSLFHVTLNYIQQPRVLHLRESQISRSNFFTNKSDVLFYIIEFSNCYNKKQQATSYFQNNYLCYKCLSFRIYIITIMTCLTCLLNIQIHTGESVASKKKGTFRF